VTLQRAKNMQCIGLTVPPGTALIYVKLEFPQFPFDMGVIDKTAR
jgi:hypothetical protein